MRYLVEFIIPGTFIRPFSLLDQLVSIIIDGEVLTTGIPGRVEVELEEGTHAYGVAAVGFKTITGGNIEVAGGPVTEEVSLEVLDPWEPVYGVNITGVNGKATAVVFPPRSPAGNPVFVYIDDIEQGKQLASITVTTVTGDSGAVPAKEFTSGTVFYFEMPAGGANLTVTLESLAEDSCFIANAAFGPKAGPAVALLRHFRDTRLLASSPGQALVNFYYNVSPGMAGLISSNDILKGMARILLIPVIALAYLAMNPWVVFMVVMPLAVAWLFQRRPVKDI